MARLWLLRWVALGLLVLLGPLLGGVASVRAQGDTITVTALEATSEFPKGIRFRVVVQSPSPLTEVSLRFHVRGQAATRYLPAEVPAGATRLETELVVRTDTYDRYLPPGSELQYSLEAKAAGGLTLQMEPRRFIYMDPRFTWSEVRDGNVSVLYYGSAGSRAKAVLPAVVLTLREMGALMGVSLADPLRVVMYNSWPDMASAIPLESAALQQQLITEGQAHAALGVILLLSSATDVVAAAAHETTHVLVFLAADNPFHEIPIWFNEGMAEYGTREPTSADYGRALARAVAQDRLIPFRQLATRPGTAEEILLMYGQGRSFVGFLVERLGADRLRVALRLFKGGLSLEAAFQGAYGAGPDELENQWRGSLGASLLPISKPQVKDTPTAVPTLSPMTLVLSTPTPEAPSRGGGWGCRPSTSAGLDLAVVLLATMVGALVVRRR